VQKLVEEIVRILVDKELEVVNVFMSENAKAAAKACGFRYNIARGSPKLEDAIPSAFGKPAALEDVPEVKQASFVESDGCDLDIAADRASWH